MIFKSSSGFVTWMPPSMVTPRAKKASGSMLAVGPVMRIFRARFGHLQQTGQGVIQDGHPGDDQQIGLGDALRRLSTAIVAALVRVLPSMTFVWFFQLSSTKRSEV